MLFTLFFATVDQIDGGWARIEISLGIYDAVLLDIPVECLAGNVVEGGYVIADLGCKP